MGNESLGRNTCRFWEKVNQFSFLSFLFLMKLNTSLLLKRILKKDLRYLHFSFKLFLENDKN